MTGSATVNYRMQEQDGETFSTSEQRLRLDWNTALSNVDLLDLYFQYSQQEQKNPDAEEIRPLFGLNLSGPEYRWLLEYREFEQENKEPGGFTQTSDTLFTTFTFEPDPEYPDLTFDFSRTESKDDQLVPQTDFVETDWGLRSIYKKGALSLRYSHRENDFDNNLTTLATINLLGVTGVAVDQAGIIYVTDVVTDVVFRFSPSGAFLGEFGGFGSGEGLFIEPSGIDVSPSFIYVVDLGNNRVERFDPQGTFISEWGTFGTGPGEFSSPYGVAVDGTGVYVTDQGNDRVEKFTADGVFLFSFGSAGSGPGNFSSPSGITSNGSLVFVADTLNHRIQAFATSGTFVTEWGTFGSAPGQFQFPVDVAVDFANRVYVTDRDNNRVQVFTTTGLFLDEFGTLGAGPGQFNFPQGIAVTPGGDVAVADTDNNRLQVLTNNGVFLFEVAFVTAEERSRSTELVSDSFSVLYSREVFQGIYASINYDLFKSDEEDKDTGEELVSTLNHDFNGQLRLQPYRWISLSSIYSLQLFSTETGDVDSDREELTQTYTLSLQPVPKVHVSTSYTLDNLRTNAGPDEESTFTTMSLNLLPTTRTTVNLSYSNQQSEQDGQKVLETDTLSATTDLKIYRGVDLNVQLSTSQTQDFESDGEIDSQRVRGNLRLRPRASMTLNTTAEYNISDSTFAGQPDISTKTMLASVDFAWAISHRLDLFTNADFIKSESAGTSTDNLSYFSDLVWRMNEKLTFFLGYRGGTDEEKVLSFRTQAKFPFYWDTLMSVNYDIEEGEETDTRFLFVELTKIF